jgi:hypothetical protein
MDGGGPLTSLVADTCALCALFWVGELTMIDVSVLRFDIRVILGGWSSRRAIMGLSPTVNLPI